VARPGNRTRLAGALALALAGCAGGRAGADAPPREVLVEVLPRAARVRLDGVALGEGSRAVPAPPPGDHVLAVAADGYEPVERRLEERELAGVRVAAALRPLGLETARALDYDDAEGLALAAAFLAARGAPRDAADYAGRALALEPDLPLAHRARGDALAALGDADGAAEAWSAYLRVRPDAPDAAAVEERIERAREAEEAP
jgi:tetratricopeptide (TPR) repeat protein